MELKQIIKPSGKKIQFTNYITDYVFLAMDIMFLGNRRKFHEYIEHLILKDLKEKEDLFKKSVALKEAATVIENAFINTTDITQYKPDYGFLKELSEVRKKVDEVSSALEKCR